MIPIMLKLMWKQLLFDFVGITRPWKIANMLCAIWQMC
ncbi:MAG: hypothetical protein K0S35_3163 [Geminicoccaceae bacterium]|nr:hypothetical protein [Geminicoccaceae bacterium]